MLHFDTYRYLMVFSETNTCKTLVAGILFKNSSLALWFLYLFFYKSRPSSHAKPHQRYVIGKRKLLA